MRQSIVIDADFLSSFLKIKRLHFVTEFYQVNTIAVAPAVYREIAPTRLAPQLAAISWVQLQAPTISTLEHLRTFAEYNLLGAGEQESIALALPIDDAILLCNDNRARRFAQSVGVQVVNIAAFLLACKTTAFLESAELERVIQDLAKLDHYRFRQDELDHLLG